MIRKLERYYRFGVAVVILHVLVVIPHSIAHTMMHIDMKTMSHPRSGLGSATIITRLPANMNP